MTTLHNSAANTNQPAIFAFDVSKDTLNLVANIGPRMIERVLANRTLEVEAQLSSLSRRALMAGHERIQVVSEPTGCYHQVLMTSARRLGLETAWVSGEAVCKMRVIETNDSGKTDLKAPYVIHTLVRLGKTLVQRDFQETYALLREWNHLYERAEVAVVESKGLLHRQLKILFPDYGFQKDFLYSRSGHALIARYGGNPYRIVRSGKARFCKGMRKAAPLIRQGSLDLLYHQAESSVRENLSQRQHELLEFRLKLYWEDYCLHQRRKADARIQLETLYEEARQSDPRLPAAEKGVINTFYLPRILAETGPVSDFSSLRQFLRYAGLNLRERQSGTYRGKTRLSKKGRRGLRRVLSQVVLPLVKKDGLFGAYYHAKRERDGMPGTKAMTVVMRKFLKLSYGWYQSGGAFDHSRVFRCESQHRQAA